MSVAGCGISCSDGEGVELSSVGDSGMADSLLGGADDRAWPQSDPSFTEEALEQGMQVLTSQLITLSDRGPQIWRPVRVRRRRGLLLWRKGSWMRGGTFQGGQELL